MGWLKLSVIAMCVWGTTCFASLPVDALGGERQDLQSITSWMAHLNTEFQGIDVYCYADLSESVVREQTIFELQLLDQVLRNKRTLPPGHLVLLACSNIVCGGKN